MNSFGLSFRVSIFGESHGEGIGIVLDALGYVAVQNDEKFSEIVEGSYAEMEAIKVKG